MNFRQIDLALDLARTLNYRVTAENMFISQPALTHQIKALEEEIGVTQKDLCQKASPIIQHCQNADTALLWISAERGVALMPDFCRDGGDRFAWIPYDWDETIPCSIAWHSDDHRPFLEAFVKIARDAFARR